MSKFKKGQLCRVIYNLLAPQCVGQAVEIIGVEAEKDGKVLYQTKEKGMKGFAVESCLEPLEAKVLDLVLMHKWYDMIDVGDKREEYRSISPYWMKRFMECYSAYDCDEVRCTNPAFPWRAYPCHPARKKVPTRYTHVRFHRGYTSTTMLWTLKGIEIGQGKEEWGAPKVKVFILKLGERI